MTEENKSKNKRIFVMVIYPAEAEVLLKYLADNPPEDEADR